MKEIFLNALEKIEKLKPFTSLSNEELAFLRELEGYRGLVLRFHTDGDDYLWQYQGFGDATQYSIDELCDFSNSFYSENDQDIGLINVEGDQFRIIITPYYRGPWHLADLILMISANPSEKLDEWNLFADHLAKRICSKYEYPDQHLVGNIFDAPEKSLSFLLSMQHLLNTDRKVFAYAPAPGYEKMQSQKWFREDSEILVPFLSKLLREYNILAATLIQRVAPDYYNQICVAAINDNEDESDFSIEPMLDDFIENCGTPINKAQITQDFYKVGRSQFNVKNTIMTGCYCMVASDAYGYLGIFLSDHQDSPLVYASQPPSPSKLMTMIANRLGLYFSHFYQLRKKAIHDRMMQCIDQTIISIRALLETTDILKELAKCFRKIFGQPSGAIFTFSLEGSQLIKSESFDDSLEDLISVEDLMENDVIRKAISNGDALDNINRRHVDLPIRYIIPMTPLPQITVDYEAQTIKSLGAVIIFESSKNRLLTLEERNVFIPHLLYGITTSLQFAFSFEEKHAAVRALEELISKLSDKDGIKNEMLNIIRKLLKVSKVSYLEMDEKGEHLQIKESFGLPKEALNQPPIKIGESISGYVAKTGLAYRTDNIEEKGEFKKRSTEQYLTKSLLSVPLISRRGTKEEKVIGVINVNNKSNGLTFSLADQRLLESIAHLVATAIDNVKYNEEKHNEELKRLESEKILGQLKDAKAVQMSLMPTNFSIYPPAVEIYGESKPAIQVGGDFFDIATLKDGRLLAILGDVSGKGMPAALLMSMTKMILKPLATSESDLVEILTKANKSLCEAKGEDDYHFVTLQLVAMDLNTGECEMSSAGHGPLQIRIGANNQEIETSKGTPLGIDGLPVKYDKTSFKMNPGDVFVMYTDGLSEEKSPSNEMFGTERIRGILGETSLDSAKALTKKLISTCEGWREKDEAHDDLTVLSVKFKGN